MRGRPTPRRRPRRAQPNAGYLRGAPPRRRRRGGGGAFPTLLALLLVAAIAGATAFVLTRPASVTVIATPADALISFASAEATVGPLEVGDLKPGTYDVTAERAGFEAASKTIELRRGRKERVTLGLSPLPQKLEVTALPKDAELTLSSGGKEVYSGKGPYRGEVPAGKLTVSLAKKGFNTYSRELFVDAETKLDLRLDPEGQLVHNLSILDCVPAPKGLALTPDDRQAWVTALVTQPSVVAYDVRTGKKLGGVDLGDSGAVELIFNRDGSRAYASQMQSASVFEIDTRSFKVLRQLKTESAWTKVIVLSPDERILYAANWSGDDVSEIDLATGKVLRRFRTEDTPRGLYPTADGTRLFVAGFGENTYEGNLEVIDLATGKSKTFFSRKGGAMRHIVADEKRGLLFTSDMGEDVVWVTDMKTLKTERLTKVDSHPNTIDLSADGRVLFVSCRGANNPRSYNLPGPEWGSILIFDAATGKPLDAVVGGNQCTALDVSPSGGLLVFSDFLDARLRVYEVPPYETLVDGGGGRYEAHFEDIKK